MDSNFYFKQPCAASEEALVAEDDEEPIAKEKDERER